MDGEVVSGQRLCKCCNLPLYPSSADIARTTEATEAQTPDVCSRCGSSMPFGPEYVCIDCDGVRYLGEGQPWVAHHDCGFEEEWKYEREARDAINAHRARCALVGESPTER